ncbi:hypothetical protein HHL19_12765 [Streptomyces sp. R302]|uniref:hypothetical protein n=1 Tax=unclassified Streptomyces TaxID=2593676 RepID=UPI00145F8DE2|nr:MULTISPECIES: hypothetical protein [unclassified Streptomyces]NML50532.1 hypothetical protein [Streptomyces sp. R301]NML79523.1 hypothetical protein [Streptomyces sp. R302]
MPVRSAWLTNRGDAAGGQTRTDTRLAPLGTFTPTGRLTSLSGVIPGSPNGATPIAGLAVTGTGPGTMTASVAPGRALIQSTEAAGAYPVSLDTALTITFADGNASNPRFDLVVLRIYDGAVDGGAETKGAIEIIQGAAAATPVVPTVPAAAIALAQVRVPAGASAGTGGIDWGTAITDRRTGTVAVGGILVGAPTAPGAYPGQFRDGGRGIERWNGTSWMPTEERHYVSVTKSGTYGLSANQYTSVVWNSAPARTDAIMWSSAQSTRLVAPVAGLYVVYTSQTWPSGAANCRTRVRINGDDSNVIQMSVVASSTGSMGDSNALPLVMAAGDYVEMQVYNSNALTGIPSSYTRAGLIWQGPA